MEGRCLLAAAPATSQFFATSAAQLQSDYHTFVTQLRDIELRSKATPAQFQTLRDDVRAISAVASAAATHPVGANAKALAATLQIDRAPLNGWIGDPGWATLSARLTTNLDALGVPRALTQRTIADMKAVADGVGLSYPRYESYSKHFNRLKSDQKSLPSNYGNIPAPGLYYTQHLRGFFRGWALAKNLHEAKLSADSRSLGSPSSSSLLRRDIWLLERLGAEVPSASFVQVHDAYVAAFAAGAPGQTELDRLRSEINAALGPVIATRRAGQVDRLVADAPAFSRATGTSPAAVATIVDDVQAVVNDGGGSALNPFRIQIYAAPRRGG